MPVMLKQNIRPNTFAMYRRKESCYALVEVRAACDDVLDFLTIPKIDNMMLELYGNCYFFLFHL